MSIFDEKKERRTEEQRNEGLSTSSFAGIGDRPASQGAGAEESRVAAASASEEQSAPLFTENDTRELRAEWDSIQTAFVDEPRRAVEQADNLVATAMKRMAQMFANERSKLEGQWDRGDNVSTEELRVALRRYRSFFNRLLSM